ncbi:MAG: glycosyltransferase family 2 protein [Anaerolineaceae bacterium]
MDVLLLSCLVFIAYTYIGYPLLLFVWSTFYRSEVKKAFATDYPFVSVVIAVRNEEKNISNRINNLLLQDYPEDKMEIIVVSDGSEDHTNSIVNELEHRLNSQHTGSSQRFKRFIQYWPSKGKPHALNTGIAQARGDIVILADARQRFSSNAILQLVANFNDENVGCVSGELVFEHSPGSSIEKELGAYWNFEKFVRKLESKTGSVAGATGAIYAIRRNLFQTIPEETILDDVLIPLNIRLQGYRVIFDGSAKAYDSMSQDARQERRRKVRTLAGNWQLLLLKPSLISPFHNPLCFKFLSHKIFRLFVPYCIVLMLAASFCLLSPLGITLIILFVFIVVLGLFATHLSSFRGICKISMLCRTILILNYFALLAPLRLMTSKRIW